MSTQITYSDVEITTEFRILHIEKYTMVDGAPDGLERFSYPPGSDVSQAHNAIKAAAAEHWNQSIIDAYKAKCERDSLAFI